MSEEIKEIAESLREISTPTGLSYSGDRTLNNSYTEKIIDYITNLQQKVEQLENIRKEAIEYVLKNKLYRFKYDDEELFEITTDKKAKDDLLNILNKGE